MLLDPSQKEPVHGRLIYAQPDILDLRVQDPGAGWRRMQPRWELIEALAGGTLALQQARTKWLPQEARESDDAYLRRLQRSICPPYLLRLESMLSGMLTRKPVRLEDTPELIEEHLFDVNFQGDDLQSWLGHTARQMIRYGHVGVLVDVGREDGTTTDRPYWVSYAPRDILDWRYAIRDGARQLVQLRLYERLEVPYREWGIEVVEQVRVLEPGRFRLYARQPSKGTDWEMVDEGTTTLPYIPFAVAYANRVADLESTPPLEEVAWLNLSAYRCGSDQDNLLHVSAIPRQFLYGVPHELEELEAGPESATALPSDARVEFVEPAGASFEARFKQLDRIEAQISQLGLAAILGQKASAETAASKAIDRSQGDASLMVVAMQLQDMLDNLIRFHADYLNIPANGRSVINTDFVSQKLEAPYIAELAKLRIAGEITQETLLRELAAGEVFGDDFDVEQELAATEADKQRRMDEMEAQMMMGEGGNLEGQQQAGDDGP